MYFTYAEHNRTFQSLGVWITGTANVTGLAEPEQVRTVAVSDGVLQTLGVPPAVGRWFSQADQVPNGPERVMLSYGYWQRRFGGDRGVIGRNIIVDSQPREIVGVMPQGFRFVDADFDLAAPLAFDRGKVILAGFGFHGIARLKPGATIAEANADLARMLPIWMDSWSNGPGSNPHIYETWKITPMIRPLKQEVIGNVGELLWVVMGTIRRGDADRLRECDEFVAGEGGSAAAGIGGAHGTRRGLDANRSRTSGRKRDARPDWRSGRRWPGVCGRALSRRDRPIESASLERNLDRCANAGIHVCSFGAVGLVVWIDSSAEICRPTQRFGSAKRGANDQCEPGAASGAEFAGRRTGGDGAGALDERRLDDSHVRSIAKGRSGICRARSTCRPSRISIPDSLIAEPERVTRTQNAILDKLAAIQGVKSAGFVSEMPMEGFDSDWDEIFAEDKVYADNTIAPLRLYKHISPGLLQHGWDKIGCRTRNDVE